MKPRIVHLKQSGELLSDRPGMRWTPSALRKAAERIQEVYLNAERLNVAGLMVVSGGGNVPDGSGRGANMRELFGADSAVARYAGDVIGRRSTVDNAIMLAAALEDLKVPYALVAAPNSGFTDIDLGEVPVYNLDLVQKAYADGKVVLIAGGTGKSGQTTDAGVVEYATWQAQAYPDTPSIALKATKYNGVFEDDPATHPKVRRYARIAATDMLAAYDRFGVVDRRCLEVLAEAGQAELDVTLQIYAADHTIAQALQDPAFGTIISDQPIDSAFAQD